MTEPIAPGGMPPTKTQTEELRRRLLEMIADRLRREHPGSIVELVKPRRRRGANQQEGAPPRSRGPAKQ
jgi:hypothetical protein